MNAETTTTQPTPCPCGGVTLFADGLTMPYAYCARSGFHIWNPVNGFEDRCPYSIGTAKTRCEPETF